MLLRGLARMSTIAALASLSIVLAPASTAGAATVYTGSGFDTCSAPSVTKMQTWLASPYRAVGIYVGGVNRACPDGNLSAGWVANAVSIGWNLLPLYVGLQAPCVSQAGLSLIDPSTAATEGTSAAEDAVARAGAFGLQPGAPIYFDMEGYKTKSVACTQVVQAFLGAWSFQLRSLGYVAGVYGSAASTIRDMVPLISLGSGPDAVWIADWNGNQSVFGDPYVADSNWALHQRLHQYRGGHKEQYGGVTINIDNDTVDAPAVGPGSVIPPTAPTQPQAGSVTTSDGQATVSWPAAAFTSPATVTATSSTLSGPMDGFAAGSYVVQLSAATSDGAAVGRFAQPVTVTFHAPPAGTVPAYAPDGVTWQALPLEVGGVPPDGSTAGYALASDGSLVVSTYAPGSIGLLRDVAPPTKPASLTGRFVGARLKLAWQRASDNSGRIASYEILLNGAPLATASGDTVTAFVRSFYPGKASVYRVTAVDAAGNASARSGPVVVKPLPRPKGVPKAIPNWAYQLAAWQQSHHLGPRPKGIPKKVPHWYWTWRNWRLHPFHVVRGGR